MWLGSRQGSVAKGASDGEDKDERDCELECGV